MSSAVSTFVCGDFPIADHQLVHPIAAGSYGEVWLARSAVGTARAVKIVCRDRFERGEDFEREFKGLQNFEPVSRAHKGLMDVLQIGRQDNWFYYVMELADDASAAKAPITYLPRTLRHDLRTRTLFSVAEVIALGLDLADALAHLHAHGLVHRDVKPSNIVFVGAVAKLADAGLVAPVNDARSLVGTIGYIAPEGPGSAQGDLYSLGKVLYEAAFGKNRQDFPQLPADLSAHPDHRQLLELNEIIVKACAHNPRERYAKAEALREDLQLLQKGRSVKRRRFWATTTGLAAKSIAAIIMLVLIAAGSFSLGDRFGWRQPLTTPQVNEQLVGQARELARLGWIENSRVSHAGIDNAERLFHEALDKDPNCIPAHTGLATLHDYATDWHYAPRKTWPLVKKHAQKILDLKPENPAGYRHLGRFQFYYDWDFARAEASLRRAILLNPNEAASHSDLATLLLALNRNAEAHAAANEVQRLAKADVGGHFTLGWMYYGFRDYPQAITNLQQCIALDPSFINARFALGWVLMDLGRHSEALRQIEGSYGDDKLDPEFLCVHAQLLALTGQREKALKIADQLQPSTPTTWYVSPYHNARLLLTLGNEGQAWDYLEQAVTERSSRLLTLPTDAFWDPYRSNPRFKAVLQSIGLPEPR